MSVLASDTLILYSRNTGLGYVSTRQNFSASVFRSFSLSLGDACNPMELFPLAAASQKLKNSACARAADLQNTKVE